MSETLIKNIIKVRDDRTPVILTQKQWGGDYSIVNEKQSSSWIPTNNGGEVKNQDLRSGVEPWLTSLFQSEHLSLLAGTGLSIAIEYIATGSAKSAMSIPILDVDLAKNIKASAKEVARKNSRGDANIEDYIRTINELLRGLEILDYNNTNNLEKKTLYENLNDALVKIINEFADSISKIEYNIATAEDDKRQEAFDYLVNFL